MLDDGLPQDGLFQLPPRHLVTHGGVLGMSSKTGRTLLGPLSWRTGAGSKGEVCYVASMRDAVAAEEELQRLNQAAFDEAGVDLTQIDVMLALTPRERLHMLYESAASLARLMGDADTD